MIGKLDGGEHQLHFTYEVRSSMGSVDPQTTATGSLKLNIDKAGRHAFAQKADPYLMANAMQDKKEVARLRKAAEGVFQGSKVVGFRVLESAWKVNRNPPGQPINREVVVASILKKPDGKCVFVGNAACEEAFGGAKTAKPSPSGAVREGVARVLSASEIAARGIPPPPSVLCSKKDRHRRTGESMHIGEPLRGGASVCRGLKRGNLRTVGVV